VENFLICSDEEVKKRLQKKAKKVRVRETRSVLDRFHDNSIPLKSILGSCI